MKIVKYIFAIAILVLLFKLVDLDTLIAAFKYLRLKHIFYLFLISILLLLVSVIKWQILLKALGESATIINLFGLYLVGYFINSFLPSVVGGDVVRSWYLGKKGSKVNAMIATLLERGTGFIAMLVLALIFMWQVEGINAQTKWLIALLITATFIFTILVFNKECFRYVMKLAPKKLHNLLEKTENAFKILKKSPIVFTKAFLLSLVFHTLTVVNTIVCAYAVGWYDVSAWKLFVVLPVILIVSALPIAPNGLGIQEGAFFYFLSQIGATKEQALAISLILRAKAIILALIGGALWLGKYKK